MAKHAKAANKKSSCEAQQQKSGSCQNQSDSMNNCR